MVNALHRHSFWTELSLAIEANERIRGWLAAWLVAWLLGWLVAWLLGWFDWTQKSLPH